MRYVCTDPAHYPIAGAWAQQRIGCEWPFANFVAITHCDGPLILATVLFSNYTRQNIEMHVASDGGRRWVSKAYLDAVWRYPFEQLGVRRVTGVVAESNAAALQFDLRAGFRIEGRLREAATDGSDLIVLGMLREECRFLKRDRHGKT